MWERIVLGDQAAVVKRKKKKNQNYKTIKNRNDAILNDSFHERGVQMLNQRPDEGHLLAGVVEDDGRIGRSAPQAVGRHDHGQVAGVHFRDGRHFRLRKYL